MLQRLPASLCHWRSDDDLLTEQFRSLRPQVATMYLALYINILFMGALAAGYDGPTALRVPIVVTALLGLRLGIWVWNKGTPRPTPSIRQMRALMTFTIVIAAIPGLGLGIWAQYLLAHSAPPVRFYIALFTTLCTVSCAACLTSLPLAAYTVIGVGTLPISLSLLMTGDTVLASMGANMLIVSPLIVGMVFRQHRQLQHMVESRAAIAAEKINVGKLAYHDALTGLANRRAFLDALTLASRGPERTTLAIAILDLNGFKLINDTYGHQTGDALLVEAARRFGQLRMGDTMIARLGGDEFAILLRDAESLTDARLRLELLIQTFEANVMIGGQAFRLRASVGLAHNGADPGTTLELINRADLAMYEAKRSRASGICVFDAAMEARTKRRSMIEQALATQADSALIDLHYQPIVDAADDQIVAFEALARWNHPILGSIPPAEFIPLAEQAGVTEPMTTHLLSVALQAAAQWPRATGLSFNLSGAELNSPTIASRILAMVAAHGFDPGRLSIEVTETELLCDFAAARAACGALQRGGVRVLLDDFGAGYASIGYLRQIRFDGIKLDGSLVTPMMDSQTARDLLIGVMQLCKAIGAPVTAEMVETQAQHDLLRALGVQKLQGFFLSRPLTAEQALAACTREDAAASAATC